MTLYEMAISYHEMYLSFVKAGFDESQAFALVAMALNTNMWTQAMERNGG